MKRTFKGLSKKKKHSSRSKMKNKFKGSSPNYMNSESNKYLKTEGQWTYRKIKGEVR